MKTKSPISPVVGAFWIAKVIQVVVCSQQIPLPQSILIFFGQVGTDSKSGEQKKQIDQLSISDVIIVCEVQILIKKEPKHDSAHIIVLV